MTTTGLAAMVFLLALSVLAYTQFLLPANEAVQCGAGYGDAYAEWVAGGQSGDEPECVNQLSRILVPVGDFLPLLMLGCRRTVRG